MSGLYVNRIGYSAEMAMKTRFKIGEKNECKQKVKSN